MPCLKPLPTRAFHRRTQPGLASTYVPIESWIYPAFDRLAAEGYLPGAFTGLRPWTRMSCARLVIEAKLNASALDLNPQGDGASLVRNLGDEFGPS
jgi:hypothetical protein